MENKYEELSIADLRIIAREKGIRNVSSYRKADLIGMLQSMAGEAEEESASVQAKSAERAEPEETRQPAGSTRHGSASAEGRQPAGTTAVGAAPAEGRRPARDTTTGTVPTEGRQPARGTSTGFVSAEGRQPSGYRNTAQAAEQTRQGAPRRNTFAGSDERRQQPDRRNTGTVSAMEEGRPAAEYRNPVSVQEERQPAAERRNPAPVQEERKTSAEPYNSAIASKTPAHGILEIMQDGFGFLRSENYLTGDNDVYVAPTQIRRFNMKTGDIVEGILRAREASEKNAALLYVSKINGFDPELAKTRPAFESMTPVYPNSRLRLETPGCSVALRILDLLSPVGKGQRGMIVSPPKAGKTTLLKAIALALKENHPDLHLIILLIDERPEEVTDLKESITGPNAEVIYSTFDEEPEHHLRVAGMVLERAKRLVEHHEDVVILMDSITRLSRACNLTVTPSGRTLSGGLDPAALYFPKKLFGAARNMREGGSLTILATALVETGSRMDDVIFEEFKGTGNMEVVLDRKLSERRIFPAIDIAKSGTRRDDLLLSDREREAMTKIHRRLTGNKADEMVESLLEQFTLTKTNQDLVERILRSL